MDFPGLQLESLTDNEINQRIADINEKLVFAHYQAGNSSMVYQLQALLETLQFEQMNRFYKKQSASQASGLVRETDPETSVKPVKPRLQKEEKKQASHPVFIPKRTSKPTSNDQ